MDPVQKYHNGKRDLLKFFKCDEDYFIKNCSNLNWEIVEDDGIFFLSYWENPENKTSAVIVKRNEKPLIFTSSNYSMIIAIDCIKIAFIFNNKKKV